MKGYGQTLTYELRHLLTVEDRGPEVTPQETRYPGSILGRDRPVQPELVPEGFKFLGWEIFQLMLGHIEHERITRQEAHHHKYEYGDDQQDDHALYQSAND